MTVRGWILLVCMSVAGCTESVENPDPEFSEPSKVTPGVVQKPAVKPAALPSTDSASGKTANDADPISRDAADKTPVASDRASNIEKPGPAPLLNVAIVSPGMAARLVVAKPGQAAVVPVVTGPRKVELLVKDKTFATDHASGALRVGFDDLDLLKVLNMEPVTIDAMDHMPPWQKGLDGKQIIIRGFMRQAFSETDLTEFLLVRDMGLCCFGPNPKIYDIIQVNMAEGTTTDYIELRPFDVVGTFHVKLQHEDDLIYGLYSIDDARIVRK